MLNAAVSFLFNRCSAFVVPYGSGCAGSGAFVPALAMTCCPSPGQSVTLSLTQGLGGASAIFFFGLAQSAIAIPGPGSCTLLIAPVWPLIVTLPLSGSGPGNGSLAFLGTIPPGSPLGIVTMQAFVIDPGVSQGYSNTNALELHVQP